MNSTIMTVHPDAEGRIDLGDLTKGVFRFRVTRGADNRIILDPEDIPDSEKWLFENPEVFDGYAASRTPRRGELQRLKKITPHI